MSILYLLVAILTLSLAQAHMPDGVAQFNIRGSRSRSPANPRVQNDRRYIDNENLLDEWKRLKKRDGSGTLEVDLDNRYTHYSIEIELGSPGQKQYLGIDTGSSDLWVIGKENPYCAKSKKEKQQAELGMKYIDCGNGDSGTFDHEKSDTFHDNKTSFSITYGDFTFAKGGFGTDVLKMGDQKIKDVSFAIGTKANSSQGVFGIGFQNYESTVAGSKGFDTSKAYDNVPIILKNQGITKSVSYSLWLNDPDSKEGNILFGGVDHKKYKGQLTKVPIVNSYEGAIDDPVEMTVILSSMSVRMSSGKRDETKVMSNDVPALLDSGTTNTYIPEDVLVAIGESLGAEFSSEVGAYVQECEASDDSKGSFIFDFSGYKVDVPFSEMLLPVRDIDGKTMKFENGKDACLLSMSPATDNIILGDSFLRSAYVVYDLENYEIAMAPVKYNEKDSDIESIGSKGIPKAKKAPHYDNTDFSTDVDVNTDIDGAMSHAPTGEDFTGSAYTGEIPVTGSAKSTGKGHHDDGDSSGAVALINNLPIGVMGGLFTLLALIIA